MNTSVVEAPGRERQGVCEGRGAWTSVTLRGEVEGELEEEAAKPTLRAL